MKCIVKDCANHNDHGWFTGNLCNPCYQFITAGKGKYSQAYRNTRPVELTDEEINDAWKQSHEDGIAMQQGFTTQQHYFAHLILRKASEK